ncbi:hypothetical protein PVAP13_3NG140875 [Panicum virgatum]|uniref:Uncharacterized protein n=1 Tax=Panicum virgatum TaxID=38727 RepID=A0A8T0U533_PANVG|nr:hypothetical protein PVAP13_3NG140875 [Panicum virgatum]
MRVLQYRHDEAPLARRPSEDGTSASASRTAMSPTGTSSSGSGGGGSGGSTSGRSTSSAVRQRNSPASPAVKYPCPGAAGARARAWPCACSFPPPRIPPPAAREPGRRLSSTMPAGSRHQVIGSVSSLPAGCNFYFKNGAQLGLGVMHINRRRCDLAYLASNGFDGIKQI